MTDISNILLCIIAGSSVLNGLFIIFGVCYITFQLRNIWEAEMVALSTIFVDDESEVSSNQD